jgi:hypothetical protein
VARVVDGVIVAVTVVQPGIGYTAPTVSFSDRNGTGSTATATVGSTAITAVTVTAGGSNYSTPSAMRSNDGSDLPINEVPQAIVDAQCELAVMSIVQGSSALFPNESDSRFAQIDRMKFGDMDIVKQYYDREVMDVERYEGFRKIELILFPILNRRIVNL